MKIAFIGLGNMGGGMAANLVKAGHDVHAFDLAEAALERARENGCTTYTSVKEAVQGADAVVLDVQHPQRPRWPGGRSGVCRPSSSPAAAWAGMRMRPSGMTSTCWSSPSCPTSCAR